jgi:hypothetical protein
MGDGIWTGERYIPDMGTLGDFGGPAGYRGGSSDSGPGLDSNAGYGGACRFEVDVTGEALWFRKNLRDPIWRWS